jgi:CDP-paratose 2-epimerase
MTRVLVTGGAGFVGSHAAEYFADKGYDVRVLDNLSRGELLKKPDPNHTFSWELLAARGDVELIKGDVRDDALVRRVTDDVDVIVHAAAQTAVTTSVTDPRPDFTTNLIGTFNVLEGARLSSRRPAVVYCSTNKVYGENVNAVGIVEHGTRYAFESAYAGGVPETLPIDRCEHTPYGCSKLGGDLYVQDYAHLYGLRTAVFRMSCIYGTRQFGVEDQGWLAWFTIAAATGRDVTIFGDGKQVRDVLWVEDLIAAYDAFLESDHAHGVYNMGGGPEHTLSLLELLDALGRRGLEPKSVSYADWRPSDQKVYVSDVSKAKRELGWSPSTTPAAGVEALVSWVEAHRDRFPR